MEDTVQFKNIYSERKNGENISSGFINIYFDKNDKFYWSEGGNIKNRFGNKYRNMKLQIKYLPFTRLILNIEYNGSAIYNAKSYVSLLLIIAIVWIIVKVLFDFSLVKLFFSKE